MPAVHSAMGANQRWCRVSVVDAEGRLLLSADLSGPGAPDLLTVDAIGHLVVAARRVRARVRVQELSPAMIELLELAALSVEMER